MVIFSYTILSLFYLNLLVKKDYLYSRCLNMKKILVSILSVCLLLFMLSGCFNSLSNKTNGNSSPSSSIATQEKASHSTPASATTSAPTSKPTSTPTPTPESMPQNQETISQKNAVRMAIDYLNYSSFSRQGLIEQLEYEGFSNEDAIYGVDQSGADWIEQAAQCAKDYLDYSSFSRQGLIEQLEYEGFTHEQAVYGVDATGLNDTSSNSNDASSSGNNASGETVSQENAVRTAIDYLNYSSFSRQGLIEQLEYEGFSNEDATYGVDQSGADWMEQAAQCAKDYLDYSSFSRQGLIEQLEYGRLFTRASRLWC